MRSATLTYKGSFEQLEAYIRYEMVEGGHLA